MITDPVDGDEGCGTLSEFNPSLGDSNYEAQLSDEGQ